MPQHIYTVSTPDQALPAPKVGCPAKHISPEAMFYLLPPEITEPDEAKRYVEEKVLAHHPGGTVKLFLQCEEWVPTTHKRSKK